MKNPEENKVHGRRYSIFGEIQVLKHGGNDSFAVFTAPFVGIGASEKSRSSICLVLLSRLIGNS